MATGQRDAMVAVVVEQVLLLPEEVAVVEKFITYTVLLEQIETFPTVVLAEPWVAILLVPALQIILVVAAMVVADHTPEDNKGQAFQAAGVEAVLLL